MYIYNNVDLHGSDFLSHRKKMDDDIYPTVVYTLKKIHTARPTVVYSTKKNSLGA